MFEKIGRPHNQIDSLIGVDTHIEGNIIFSGGVRIDGRVTGNITGLNDMPSTLVLSDQAVVEGVIHVSHAVINGTVVGTIKVTEYVELQPKAKVCGDVHYKGMEIHLGASVQGMLLHTEILECGSNVVTLLPAAQIKDLKHV